MLLGVNLGSPSALLVSSEFCGCGGPAPTSLSCPVLPGAPAADSNKSILETHPCLSCVPGAWVVMGVGGARLNHRAESLLWDKMARLPLRPLPESLWVWDTRTQALAQRWS